MDILKHNHQNDDGKVKIIEGVRYISTFNLKGNKSIREIHIPNSVTYITPGAFSDCPALETITVGPDNARYKSEDNCCLSKDGTILIFGCKNSIIPNSVKKIESLAFSGCTGLSEIAIPENVCNVGGGAFSGCTGLLGLNKIKISPNSRAALIISKNPTQYFPDGVYIPRPTIKGSIGLAITETPIPFVEEQIKKDMSGDYEQISFVQNRYLGSCYIVKKDNLYGIVGPDNNLAIPCSYEEISINDDFWVLKNGKEYCFLSPDFEDLNHDNEDLIFDKIEYICPKTWKVKKNDYYGVLAIDSDNKVWMANPCIFDDIHVLGSYWKVSIKGKWGILNQDFIMIVPSAYDYIDIVRDIAIAGTDFFAFDYEYGEPIRHTGFIAINLANIKEKDYPEEHLSASFIPKCNENDLLNDCDIIPNFIEVSGNLYSIAGNVYDAVCNLRELPEDLYLVKNKIGKYKIIKFEGGNEIVIKHSFALVKPIGDLMLIRKNGKYGLFDGEKIVIKCEYDDITYLENGVWEAVTNGKKKFFYNL